MKADTEYCLYYLITDYVQQLTYQCSSEIVFLLLTVLKTSEQYHLRHQHPILQLSRVGCVNAQQFLLLQYNTELKTHYRTATTKAACTHPCSRDCSFTLTLPPPHSHNHHHSHPHLHPCRLSLPHHHPSHHPLHPARSQRGNL